MTTQQDTPFQYLVHDPSLLVVQDFLQDCAVTCTCMMKMYNNAAHMSSKAIGATVYKVTCSVTSPEPMYLCWGPLSCTGSDSSCVHLHHDFTAKLYSLYILLFVSVNWQGQITESRPVLTRAISIPVTRSTYITDQNWRAI